MAALTQVERDAMARAAQQLDQAHSTVMGLRTQLQGHKADLMGGWLGEAATAFNNVFERFDADFQKVLTAMDTLHTKLVSSHTQYVATEAQQAETVNRVAGLINNG